MFDRHRVRQLAAGPFWSIPRIGLDLALWAGLVALAAWLDEGWMTFLAVSLIGAVCMHDLLVHGHEGVHGHISSHRSVNGFFTWLVHALVGLSGSGYRAFHLAHHRHAHTEKDPEFRLLERIRRGAPGWAFLGIPLLAHVEVNSYVFRNRVSRAERLAVTLELTAMGALHGLAGWTLGWKTYSWYVVLPIFTSLAAVVVLRSITEHHGAPAGDRWTNTRTVRTSPWLQLLWSNTSFHLEHHLYPSVPFHKLPELSRLLETEQERRGSPRNRGFLRTALRLLTARRHFGVRERRSAS